MAFCFQFGYRFFDSTAAGSNTDNEHVTFVMLSIVKERFIVIGYRF